MTTETPSIPTDLSKLKNVGRKYAFHISLCIVAFTIPFPTVVNNISIIVVSLLWLLTIEKDWSRFKNVFLILSTFFPFYLWYAVGIVYSDNENVAVNLVLERSATFFIFPLILVSSKETLFPLKGILYSFIAGYLLILCFSLGEIILKIHNSAEPLSFLLTKYTRWNFIENSSFSYHTPYMGLHAVFCFTIVLFCIKANSLLSFFIKISLLSILILGIYIFGSKLPFILLLLVSLFYLSYEILSNHLAFATINIIVAGLLVFCTTIIYFYRTDIISTIKINTETENLYWGSLPNRFQKFLEVGDEDRIENWEAAICAISKNPVYGSGTGDGLESLQSCRSVSSWNHVNKVNAHNQFFDITVRSGLVGLVLFLASLISCFRLPFLDGNRLYLVFLISFTIGLIFESFLDRQKGVVFFTYFNTLFLSYQYTYVRANKGKN